MEMIILHPVDGRKSFDGKAYYMKNDDGSRTLYSYGTKIITQNPDNTFVKHWNGWTSTTGRHIIAFCGMKKSEWDKLPINQ